MEKNLMRMRNMSIHKWNRPRFERGLFLCINLTQDSKESGTEGTPDQCIGKTYLTVQIQRYMPIIPYLVVPVPDLTACIFNSCDSNAAKDSFCTYSTWQLTDVA